jgi:hypothetical protein
MKNLLALSLALALSACSTVTPITEHQATVGQVKIVYAGKDWTTISSTGTAPLHNHTVTALTEASKLAAMRARQNISAFLSNSVASHNDAETVSHTDSHGQAADKHDAGDQSVLTTVVENIRESSASILRGVQVTDSTTLDDMVVVKVEVSRQSIDAAKSIQESLK